MDAIYCYDPTKSDSLSKVRGVGRYLQILKENFPKWHFSSSLTPNPYTLKPIFINPFFNFLQPPLISKRIAKRQIAVIHDLIPLKYPKYFPVGIRGRINIFRNKLALKDYDLIVTDSHASKKDILYILKIKEEKIRVIYPTLPKIFNQVDSSKKLVDRKEKNQNSNPQLLATNYYLYVGDATWNKNLVNLAKAIKIANITCVFVGKVFEGMVESSKKQIVREDANQNPNYSLLTTNYLKHPWQREFKSFLKETEGDKRFVFLGFVPDAQLIQLYQNAIGNLLISRDEGYGFSYLEAATNSTPSILSNLNVFREVSKNKGALYVNPENPTNIAQAINQLYSNKELRNKLSKEAQERSRFFNPRKFTEAFLKIINSDL